VVETAIFATYKRQQTMLESQKILNFLSEMQSKVTTNCDNSSGTESKTWGFGWGGFKTTTENPSKTLRKLAKKLYNQHMEWWRHLANLA